MSAERTGRAEHASQASQASQATQATQASQASQARPRRSVSGRLLASYVIVLLAFAVTTMWCFQSLRAAARDANSLRNAYLPLMSSIGEALAGQDVMNAQLNHVTSARNPDDVRVWMSIARRLRPLSMARIRSDARDGLAQEGSQGGAQRGAEATLRKAVLAKCDAIEVLMRGQGAKIDVLFQALRQGRRAEAERVRDELVATESEVAKRFRLLRQQVDHAMRARIQAMRVREGLSMQLLIALSVLTLFVGLVTSVYVRRVLKPLGHVTSRARAVAAGDLSPHEVLHTGDELGELAETFEDMVAAIRQTRADLVQAERLATIGKMAAQITHEVRNPLSSIGLNLELLEDELANSTEGSQLLSAIQSEVDRLAEIADKYLAVVRQPQLNLSQENLVDLVRECHAFMEPELTRAGVRSSVVVAFDAAAEGEAALVQVDEAQLRQALVNLLRNACQAAAPDGEVWLRVVRDDGGLSVRIEDDGCGIDTDDGEQCFDPFYTTKSGGTGLGLAVTRAIVESHGGRVHHAHREAGGSVFVVALPSWHEPDFVSRSESNSSRQPSARSPHPSGQVP
jgi:signal transduction histidine kinase